MLEPSRPTGIGDLMPSSHHQVGQCIPIPDSETDRIHITPTSSHKKMTFQGLFQGDPTLRTAQEEDAGHAVLDRYPPIPYQD